MHVEIRDAILIKSPQCLALFMHGCILVLLASRLVSSFGTLLLHRASPFPSRTPRRATIGVLAFRNYLGHYFGIRQRSKYSCFFGKMLN